VKIREIVITLALCVTALVASHWISESLRYEVVAAGAGSGGSQESTGSTDIRAYLVDRKTGRTWILWGNTQVMQMPTMRISCKETFGENAADTESGCEKIK
jgi:hypothetical protein